MDILYTVVIATLVLSICALLYEVFLHNAELHSNKALGEKCDEDKEETTALLAKQQDHLMNFVVQAEKRIVDEMAEMASEIHQRLQSEFDKKLAATEKKIREEVTASTAAAITAAFTTAMDQERKRMKHINGSLKSAKVYVNQCAEAVESVTNDVKNYYNTLCPIINETGVRQWVTPAAMVEFYGYQTRLLDPQMRLQEAHQEVANLEQKLTAVQSLYEHNQMMVAVRNNK